MNTATMASKGRYGDTMMAHVTKGEAVVPRQVLMQNPLLAMHIVHAIRNAGADPARYIVGAVRNSTNPKTGHPEYGFFHSIGKIFKSVAPVVLPILASIAAPALAPALGISAGAAGALGGAAGGLAGSAIGGGSIGQDLLGAALGGAGGYVSGSGGLSNAASNISSAISGAPQDITEAGTSAIGANPSGILTMGASGAPSTAAASSGLGLGALANDAGDVAKIVSAATGIMGQQQKPQSQAQTPAVTTEAQAPAFNPTQPAAMQMPSSLNSYSSDDPTQLRTALATQGLNGGLGQQEQSYYSNLLQRSLIGSNNQVTTDPNFLSPIESQYWARQGLNTSDPTSFLKGLAGLSS